MFGVKLSTTFAPLTEQCYPIGVSGGDQQVASDPGRVFLNWWRRLP